MCVNKRSNDVAWAARVTRERENTRSDIERAESKQFARVCWCLVHFWDTVSSIWVLESRKSIFLANVYHNIEQCGSVFDASVLARKIKCSDSVKKKIKRKALNPWFDDQLYNYVKDVAILNVRRKVFDDQKKTIPRPNTEKTFFFRTYRKIFSRVFLENTIW